jgi:hypothetical protein
MRSRFSLSAGPTPKRASEIARNKMKQSKKASPRLPARSPASAREMSETESTAIPTRIPENHDFPIGRDSPPRVSHNDLVEDYEQLAENYVELLLKRAQLTEQNQTLSNDLTAAFQEQAQIEDEIRAKSRPSSRQSDLT